MRPTHPGERTPAPEEPALSDREFCALQQACGPVGLLRFPPPDIIRILRRQGYVEVVLGGIQITPKGLERLLQERKRGRTIKADLDDPSAG